MYEWNELDSVIVMKKLWFRQFLVVLLVLILFSSITIYSSFGIPTTPSPSYLHSNINIDSGTIFRTTTNNASFIMGNDFTFYRTVVDSDYLWLDKSYTSKKYTLYCIYVTTPNNASFNVNTWFATKDSTGSLTINSPLVTNINLFFYSPNLITASATGVVSQSWNATSKTLTMVVNSDVNPIVISATVTETEFNIPPENYALTITDMEGCGAWVFSETEYYTFQAQYWDGDGYADLDTMKINFSDGVNTIVAIYDQPETEWSLESGSDVVRLKAGTATALDSNLLQVTFLIYFQNTILDALDIDLYAWCNDTSGAEDGWDQMQTDYFNIYNLGGHATLETSGNAGRLVGGDVFDLYAYNDSWAEAYMLFRNLQHVKLLPTVLIQTNPGWYEDHLVLTYYIDYCVDDTWIEGFKLVLRSQLAWTLRNGNSERIWNWTVESYIGEQLIKTENIYVYHLIPTDIWGDRKTNFWIDLWFNKVNSSSTFGARVNAYYFPMTDSSNVWLRWLTGSNWGADEARRKQSMTFATLLDSNNNVVYAPQIEMVKLGFRLEWEPTGTTQYAQVSEYDVFDLSFGSDPMEGIQTPVFDETRVPIMPQGGFLGALVVWLGQVVKRLGEVFGPTILDFWYAFVNFLDTVFTEFGWPNGFSQLLSWIGNFALWLADSFTYLISLLTSVFLFLMAIVEKLANTLSTIITQWVAIIQGIFGMLGDSMNTGVNLWNDLNLGTWVILMAIMYPVFLLLMWDEKGIDAPINHVKMLCDILALIGHVFITVIQVFLRLIGRLIESIPVVE